MKEQLLVEYIAKSLVEHVDEVNVNVVEGERLTLLELKVHESDVGKVIGRYGSIAKALRTVLASGARKTGKRVALEILD